MSRQRPRPEDAVRARLRELAAGDRRWQAVRDDGDWGDTRHTERIARKVKKLLYCIDPRPGRCYGNALEAVRNSPGDVTYVEGLAAAGEGADPTPHAWVQIDGTVLELTWTERAAVPLPAEHSAYYGVAIDRETLRAVDSGSERAPGEPFLPAALVE